MIEGVQNMFENFKDFNKQLRVQVMSMKEELLLISKRLADIAKEINNFTEEKKQYIVERAEEISPSSLIDLYNILGEYGKL